MRTKLAVLISLAVLVTLNLAAAQLDPKTDNIPLRNWAVAFDRVSAPQATGRFVASALSVGPQGATFVPVTPCRVVDTRTANGPFGGPIFQPGDSRSYVIPSGACSVPAASAYSLNFTISQYTGKGNLKAYPTGTTPPLTSVINYGSGPNLANAAIVPANAQGSITVDAATTATPGPTHVIIDINGYFTDQTATSANIANTLVLRDANGDFSAGIITGTKVIGAVYGQDLAEWVPSSVLRAGDVVVLDPADGRRVIASSQAYDTTVAGVVSANPGIILGMAASDKSQIATTGRVKVFVDADIAPIRVGDLLVTSDVAGTAMRSMPMSVDGHSFHRPGTIVGKALQPLASGKGQILMLLSLQ